jgi:hypothetical protein
MPSTRGHGGHYVVRRGLPTRIYWAQPGQPDMLFTTITEERVPLLAKALAEYVANGDSPAPAAAVRPARRVPADRPDDRRGPDGGSPS